MLILAILVLGLSAGWFAHLLVGHGGPNWGQLLIVGLAGSFIGGTISSLISGDGFDIHLSGVLGSIIGATLLLLIVGAVRSGGPRRAH